jgi:transposase
MHHKAREMLVAQRTQLINALRGHLAEMGVIDKASRLRRLKRAAAQKSTGLLPQRTHCYGCQPVDMATR